MKSKNKFVVGSDVIALLLGEKHPMIMVDRIVYYDPDKGILHSEKYISANDPVFIGHFPDFKLWPGIFTIEGLRQSCVLLSVLKRLREVDQLEGVMALENHYKLKPKADLDLCQQLITALDRTQIPGQSNIKIRVKLKTPVFAGCKMIYQIIGLKSKHKNWKVMALVNEREVASGFIDSVEE